jgi:hypothetical protein
MVAILIPVIGLPIAILLATALPFVAAVPIVGPYLAFLGLIVAF